MILLNEEFNILEHFSHIIKKKNLNIYLILSDISIYNNMIKNIKGEECEKNVHIYMNNEYDRISTVISDKILNYIYIFNLLSLSILNDFLKGIKNIINNKSLIYLYVNIYNGSYKKIEYKNRMINYLSKYTSLKINKIIDLKSILSVINDNIYEIESMNKYLKQNYLFIGENNMYEIIIRKNSIDEDG
jgi:hypothetical protein